MQLLPHSGTQFPVMLPIVLFQWDFRCTLAVRPYGLLHFIICLLAFATLPPMPAILHLMARSVAPLILPKAAFCPVVCVALHLLL